MLKHKAYLMQMPDQLPQFPVLRDVGHVLDGSGPSIWLCETERYARLVCKQFPGVLQLLPPGGCTQGAGSTPCRLL
jgi:hypothetical protein